MNDRANMCAVVMLGILGIVSLLVAMAMAFEGKDPPPGIAAVAGASVGALAGLIHGRDRP